MWLPTEACHAAGISLRGLGGDLGRRMPDTRPFQIALVRRATYEDVIMRTIVDLTEEQVKSLAALCAARGISRAEAVRRAVAKLLAEEQRPGREQAFGAWKRKNPDAAEVVRTLREEWRRSRR